MSGKTILVVACVFIGLPAIAYFSRLLLDLAVKFCQSVNFMAKNQHREWGTPFEAVGLIAILLCGGTADTPIAYIVYVALGGLTLWTVGWIINHWPNSERATRNKLVRRYQNREEL